jgi:lipopolysaccharide heptosyltransferase II
MGIKKIIVFNPFGIGDVLFSTPLVRNLKSSHPESTITYLCNRRTYPLLAPNPLIDEVIVFEKDEWRKVLKESKIAFCKNYFNFYQKIRSASYDVMFDLSMNSQYGLFFKLAAIPVRIGYNYRGRGRFLTHKTELPGGYSDKHVARYHLDLLKHIGEDFKEYPFDLNVKSDSTNAAKEKLTSLGVDFDNPVIGVCPGSGDSWQSQATYKQWPRECYLKVLKNIIEELSATIVLFGSPSERSICDHIASDLSSDAVVNLCGEADLNEFCSLLSLSDLLITNDGGPFHISQALGKKSIVFFGPVDASVYGPYPDERLATVFSADVECRPCYQSFRFTGCSFAKRCLNEISPDEVFSTIKDALML